LGIGKFSGVLLIGSGQLLLQVQALVLLDANLPGGRRADFGQGALMTKKVYRRVGEIVKPTK
jgi:hypothetical protein